MFRSSTIIRKLALNLVKVTFTLKIRGHYVVNYDAVVWQHVMEWRVCCMLCRMRQSRILRKYNFSQVLCKLPDDGRRPKHVGGMFVYFNVNFNVF